MHPAEAAAQNFVQFIQNRAPLGRQPDDQVHLWHCLSSWLQFGDGAKATNGDFVTFVLAALVVVDWLQVDSALLDYRYTISRRRRRSIRRRVERLLGEDATYGLSALEELFDAYVTRRHAAVRDSPA